MSNTGETINPDRVITKEFVKNRLGFRLSIIFPDFETDAAGIVAFSEEIEEAGSSLGWQNVLGSLYFDGDELKLGLFVRDGSVPPLEDESRPQAI